METKVSFQPNDIIYARVQYAGCSYHHTFAKVVRITKTGKYRIQPIGSISTKEEKGDFAQKYTRVIPDPGVETSKTRLLNSEGHCKGLWFEKYEPTTEVWNYFDLGD